MMDETSRRSLNALTEDNHNRRLVETLSQPEHLWYTTPKCQLLFLSAAFFFVFTGFGGVQNLESSIDLGEVSGSVCFGIIYVVFVVICLFAPVIVKYLSLKTTILVQFFIFGLFCVLHIWPEV